tara:strand:+ start:91 stop:492 length:402 start_codon:yes stop_codon:yes gene_type:complete
VKSLDIPGNDVEKNNNNKRHTLDVYEDSILLGSEFAEEEATGPINYQVKIKKAEAGAYWDLHASAGEQDKRGYFIMGHRIRNSTVSYKLLAQGIPELRERLQEQLESKGFTDVEVIPDGSYPYKWLPSRAGAK